MTKVGIDALAFYTSHYVLDLALLAKARGVDPDKFFVGLGQRTMSVPPPGEDIVSMAANAAKQVVRDADLAAIEMLLFATESGIDQSKAAGTYIHDLLALPARCRVVELKQACYAGTASLQLALNFLRVHPDKKVLVIGSDIARYGFGMQGESTQGCAAVAMVLSANPRILAFDPEYGVVTQNAMDFWRPNYLDRALIEGKYSSKLYLTMLEKTWEQYQALSGRGFNDHAYYCYHTPVPRLVEKAHHSLLKLSGQGHLPETEWLKQIQDSLEYGRQIGNSYTAALYVSLASLLDLVKEDLTGKRIGFYSYGSGCVAEYFSGVIQPGYREALHTDYHTQLLANRISLTYQEYESFYSFKYPEDGSVMEVPSYRTGHFRLTRLQDHKRIYEQLDSPRLDLASSVRQVLGLSANNVAAIESVPRAAVNEAYIMKVFAPGKLILSGEHAVVHGGPALAMAVNRYVTATVTREHEEDISFHLSDLSHRSRLSVRALEHLKARVKRKYHRFIRGDFSIRKVLQKPFELAQFAFSLLTDTLNLSLPHGVKVHVQSDVPIGCGMGSSAATILSVIQAIASYMHIPLSQEKLFQLALEAENMQHGHSSGLDLRVSLQGGCLYMHGQETQPRSVPALPMYLVNTGVPQTSTGECVEKVAPLFKSNGLCDDFAAVTNIMDEALQQKKWRDMQDAVQQNHKLLVKIGVVPSKVQTFISQVESVGGAAKICGAGAVAGERAGVVLAMAEDKIALTELCNRYSYSFMPVSGESRGVRAV